MSITTMRLYQTALSARLRAVAARARRLHWSLGALLALLTGAFLLHGLHRGHAYLRPSDEAVHAIVAEHLKLHPLTPTLYEIGALSPADLTIWAQAHIWLHIPPFGMWASALAMRILGDTPYANRLPGLLFILGGMVVTYLLGRRLYGPGAGLVGAAFAGFVPYALINSQGYYFGDITETPLMFFTPLAVLGSVLAYQTGKYRWLLLAGAAQGICYLDKGALGLAPTAVMLALALSERFFPMEAGWARLRLRGVALFLGAFTVVALPYNLYLLWAFPAESAAEQQVWKANFLTSVEHWGRPPDYHFTIYLYAMYGPALALLLL
ncbi:MAG: glycosyltransferase family 39 protein, partial [Ktedonobacterales bacterium]|nr:glycosyltransferase family 39 protein [Ktedonobacterales bacterium]